MGLYLEGTADSAHFPLAIRETNSAHAKLEWRYRDSFDEIIALAFDVQCEHWAAKIKTLEIGLERLAVLLRAHHAAAQTDLCCPHAANMFGRIHAAECLSEARGAEIRERLNNHEAALSSARDQMAYWMPSEMSDKAWRATQHIRPWPDKAWIRYDGTVYLVRDARLYIGLAGL